MELHLRREQSFKSVLWELHLYYFHSLFVTFFNLQLEHADKLKRAS